jgi:hypothetical protein
MRERLDKYVEGLFAPYYSAWNERSFVSLIYAWFVFYAFWNWHSIWLIWGTESVCIRFSANDTQINNLVYALMYHLNWFKPVFIIHIVVSLFSIFHFRGVFIFRLLAWLSALWIYYAGIDSTNAGYVYMTLLMFFCIPYTSKSSNPFWSFIARLALFAARIQVGLIYFYASLYKLTSEQWWNGEVIYQTVANDWFSVEILQNLMLESPPFVALFISYFVMFFQFSFPLTINWKKTRKYAIMIGVSIHLYIGIFMHMLDFALAMMIPYVLFLNSNSDPREI